MSKRVEEFHCFAKRLFSLISKSKILFIFNIYTLFEKSATMAEYFKSWVKVPLTIYFSVSYGYMYAITTPIVAAENDSPADLACGSL